MSVLAGLSAFPVTPANADGVVDTEALGRLVERLRVDGVSSIGVLGSTGGYMYLDAAQRDRALRAAVEAAGDMPVLAGIGDLTTRNVLRHVQSAEAAGASALLLAPVSYLPLTLTDMTALFETVAGASDLPLCFYDNPGTTGVTPSEDLVIALAKAGHIAAIKNPPAPQGDFAGQIARFREATDERFTIGYSGDASIAGALSAGADAWYSVLAGTLPDAAVALWNARDDATELAHIDAALAPLWRTFDTHGSIRVIHEVVRMMGLADAALPHPLLPLDQESRAAIEQTLDAIS